MMKELYDRHCRHITCDWSHGGGGLGWRYGCAFCTPGSANRTVPPNCHAVAISYHLILEPKYTGFTIVITLSYEAETTPFLAALKVVEKERERDKLVQVCLTCTSITLTLILRQGDRILHAITKHIPRLIPKRLTMRQRIPCNRLERFVYINSILGRNFKIRNRRLTRLAPRQRSLLSHLPPPNVSSTF